MIIKPNVTDAPEIQKLIGSFAAKRAMLPRSLNYLYENIRDFWVYKEDGKIIGCCSLHIVGWEGLGEIKSLSVAEDAHKRGLGKLLVERCMQEARDIGLTKTFALTYVPGFFKKLGYRECSKDELPHKIWADCIDCPSFPNCDEIAVVTEL